VTRTGIRASAIIIWNNKILLIHRKKEGKEYWVFPGGGIEEGETGEETILREIEEETGLTGKNARLAFLDLHPWDKKEHPFYFVEVKGGKVKLGGPEVERNSENNWYNPEWVSLATVNNLNLLPETAKNKLIRLMKRKKQTSFLIEI